MRYVIDLDHDGDGHARGTVTDGGGAAPVAFSGWLELLRLLEAASWPPPVSDGPLRDGQAPTPTL